jgi:hypothetical protein
MNIISDVCCSRGIEIRFFLQDLLSAKHLLSLIEGKLSRVGLESIISLLGIFCTSKVATLFLKFKYVTNSSKRKETGRMFTNMVSRVQ